MQYPPNQHNWATDSVCCNVKECGRSRVQHTARIATVTRQTNTKLHTHTHSQADSLSLSLSFLITLLIPIITHSLCSFSVSPNLDYLRHGTLLSSLYPVYLQKASTKCTHPPCTV